jgi:hypothetical protein
MAYLNEEINFDRANMLVERDEQGGNKNLYMKGIFIQGDVSNANQRIYPSSEIRKAVESINERLRGGYSILGEVDHPDNMNINIDRVSHKINEMKMVGSDGYGVLEIIPTPMGVLIEKLLTANVKLGVSSRGNGDVDPYTRKVSNYEILTVDIVAQPSAPDAYPKALYESLMRSKYGNTALELAGASLVDTAANKHLERELLRVINELKLKK